MLGICYHENQKPIPSKPLLPILPRPPLATTLALFCVLFIIVRLAPNIVVAK